MDRCGPTRGDHLQKLVMCSPHIKELEITFTLDIGIQLNCCRRMVSKHTWRVKVHMSGTLQRRL
jgi:DNA-directed RNA polymerase subunit N (RpoN/RPB10)